MNTIDTLHNRYGAAELKEGYNRNLALALILSIALHALAIVVYLLLNPAKPAMRDLGVVIDIPRDTIVYAPRDDKPKEEEKLKKKVEGKSKGSRGKGSAGDRSKGGGTTGGTRTVRGDLPLPSSTPREDSLLANGPLPDGRPLDGGGGGGKDTLPSGGGGDDDHPIHQLPDEDLPPDEPSFAEQHPTYDLDELNRKVSYPEIARRARLEGVVVVRALIARTGGRPLKVIIDQSASPLLSEEAMEAVLSVAFTPAIQNGIPVPMWVQVPITFELD